MINNTFNEKLIKDLINKMYKKEDVLIIICGIIKDSKTKLYLMDDSNEMKIERVDFDHIMNEILYYAEKGLKS